MAGSTRVTKENQVKIWIVEKCWNPRPFDLDTLVPIFVALDTALIVNEKKQGGLVSVK